MQDASMCLCNSTYNPKQNVRSCGGYVVLTLKLPKNSKEQHINNATNVAIKQLSAVNCHDFHVVHLQANSINERTLLCRVGGCRKK
jgi:hypothetical protein